jgi:hypothetical protein
MDEGAKVIKRGEFHELVWKEPLLPPSSSLGGIRRRSV